MSFIEHLYEVFFFLTLVVPLAFILSKKTILILKEKNNVRIQNKKNLHSLIESFTEKQNKIKVDLKAERFRHSKLPNYLNEFEKTTREAVQKKNNKILADFQLKLGAQIAKEIKDNEVHAIRLFMEKFRANFIESTDKNINLDRILLAIKENEEDEKQSRR